MTISRGKGLIWPATLFFIAGIFFCAHVTPAHATGFTYDPGGTLTSSLSSYFKLDTDSADVFGSDGSGTTSGVSYSAHTSPLTGLSSYADSGGGQMSMVYGNVNDMGTAAFSVAFWMKMSSGGNGNNYDYLVAKSNGDGKNEWEIDVFHISSQGGQPHKIGFTTFGSTFVTPQVLSSKTSVDDGTWHFVTVTRDGSNNRDIYIDGRV